MMLQYSKELSKWRAYQLGDPFAAGLFLLCNKLTHKYCQPDCDANPVTSLRLEVRFVNLSDEARGLGFVPCTHCQPDLPPLFDVHLLLRVVERVNHAIGFVPPLVDEDELQNDMHIQEKLSRDGALNGRRLLLSAIGSLGSTHKAAELVLKNDSDHFRLVDMACRHLALAAAATTLGDPLSPGALPLSERAPKRRGGVLGFKELAAKLKLSAWHFHRVFKSVTKMTPKAYGDKCIEFLKQWQEDVASGGDGSRVAVLGILPRTPGRSVLHKRAASAAFPDSLKRARTDADPLDRQTAQALELIDHLDSLLLLFRGTFELPLSTLQVDPVALLATPLLQASAGRNLPEYYQHWLESNPELVTPSTEMAQALLFPFMSLETLPLELELGQSQPLLLEFLKPYMLLTPQLEPFGAESEPDWWQMAGLEDIVEQPDKSAWQLLRVDEMVGEVGFD